MKTFQAATSVFVLTLMMYVPAKSQKVEGKNLGKINLTTFVVKGFGLQYERQLTRKMTAALSYSKIPTSSLPFKTYIENQVNDPGVNISAYRLGTSIVTPEIRFYLSKKGAFHGFYIAPYARFGSYEITGPVNFTSTLSGQRTAIFNGKVNATTGGLLFGSNFQLSKNLYLDWWIIGASIGGANGNLAAIIQLSPDEQISLKNTIDNVNVPFTKIQSAVNSNGATVSTTGTMVGLRGLGLNIGYRF